MSFAEKASRIVDMYEWEREYYEWLKLPTWKRYEGDHINGLDDGEEPRAHSSPTHAELEELVGHKLIDLDREKIPY